MKQRTYSDIKPEKNFSIENVENGKCTVLFFDNIQEEREKYVENCRIMSKNKEEEYIDSLVKELDISNT